MSSMALVKLQIRELAKKKGWTLKEVSIRSGVNYSTIKTYATSSGMVMADIMSLIKLARVFDVTIEDLIEIVEE